MTIPELANLINQYSTGYKIGKLQSIRKELKEMDRTAGHTIFDERTVNDDWAFHFGGRTEIQFNIGLEKEGIRYGLAFSLEPSFTLPDVSVLFPKVLKLNCLINEQPELFADYKMWYWQNGKRSKPEPVFGISEKMTSTHTFIFFGKLSPNDSIDVQDVLQTFDDLLQIYITVESTKSIPAAKSAAQAEKEFKFLKKQKKLPKSATYSTVEREINVSVRHSYLQELLIAQLEKEYGEENVSFENECRGKRVDVVARDGDKIHFYEIKVASSVQACIRQSMGQLMEYAYGDGKINAHGLFTAGEHPLNKESKKYLAFLQEEFKIAIHYIQILK
jgi:hypothetical protein